MRYSFTARTGEKLEVSDNRTEAEAWTAGPGIAKSWGATLDNMKADGSQQVRPVKRDQRKSR